MKEKELDTLIFDLGGVIIDLHVDKTISALAGIAGKTPDHIKDSYGKPPFFDSYEKGLITSQEYREELRKYINSQEVSDEILDRAWNAMLGEINKERIDKLIELRKSHNLLLLSNTNAIHIPVFNRILKGTSGHNSLHDLFDKVYFSYEINMRKPDHEIFQFVLDDNSLKPESALFLDDTLENIKAAQDLGINTLRVNYPDQWLNLFYGRD